MDEIKALMFDIGGVLYVGDTPINDASKTIKTLRTFFPLRFITNSTRLPPQKIASSLHTMGFDIAQQELFTALDATKRYIEEKDASVFTLLTKEASEYFKEYEDDNPDYIIIGDAHQEFNYDNLNQAFRLLMNGAKLIACIENRYFKDSDNKLSMDAGGFVKALEYATQKKAIIIGKPSADFFHMAASSLRLKPHEILMIGDDIESDIKGAQEAGFKAALVKSGKFQSNDLQKNIKPDFILENISQLPKLFGI